MVAADTAGYANAFETYYPTALFLVRHCNGAYDLRTIVDPSITPAPPLLSTRAMVVTQFSGDPAGTIYSGGFDAHAIRRTTPIGSTEAFRNDDARRRINLQRLLPQLSSPSISDKAETRKTEKHHRPG